MKSRHRPRNGRVCRRAGVLAVLALVAALLVVLGCGREESSGLEFYCPMHPTYVSDKPGDCPICNMRLDPRPKAAVASEGHAEHGAGRAPAAKGTTTSVLGRAPVVLDARSRALAGVRVAVAERARLDRSVRTVGTVRPDESRLQHIHVKISGFVERLYIRTTGQLVRRGEPVLDLYSPELVASQDEYLRALQAWRELSESEFVDVRRGAEDLMRAARRRLDLLDVPDEFVAELERSNKSQRAVTLRSHAAGYVVAKNVVEGAQVEPGMELFTLADLSRVWVEAKVYENESSLLRLGQRASVTLPHDPAHRLAGQIAFISPYVDTASRTLGVRFEFANADLALKPGMFVDVWLDVAAAEGVVVPESALLDTGERRLVFVVQPGHRFEPREVRTGLRSEGRVEVLSGLAAGDSVVVGANFLLDSESRLRGALGAATRPDAQPAPAHRSHAGETP